MKRIISVSLSLLLVFLLLVSLCGCEGVKSNSTETSASLWDNAIYQEDTILGSGAKEVKVEVKAQDKSVTFTIHTDEATVGNALLENDLIAGDSSDYGLFIKVVNGMTADYDVDQHYWAFYVDGEYAMTAVEATEITEGTAYRLEYAK